MRITFLVPNDHASGGMRAVHEYSRHLAARGHEVHILIDASGRFAGSSGRELTRFQVMERRVKRRLRVLRSVPAVVGRFGPATGLRFLALSFAPRRHASSCASPHVRTRFVSRVDPTHVPSADALVVYDWSTALSAESLPAECGRRFYLVQAEESMCGAPAELVAASMRLPCCRIVISSWLKRTLAERYGVTAEGPIVNGVDFHSFHDMGWSPARLHTIGMVYASPPYKGGANGLRAFALAKQQFADLRMALFGRDLPAFRTPQGVRFHYDPPQRELRPLYCSCGIWLVPSLIEGGGMPAQEAMACGCALVTTDVGAVRDFAQEGRNVVIVPPGDIEAMASAIVSLLRDEQLQRRIAACAAADIRAWSWERAAAQLEAIFQRHIGAA